LYISTAVAVIRTLPFAFTEACRFLQPLEGSDAGFETCPTVSLVPCLEELLSIRLSRLPGLPDPRLLFSPRLFSSIYAASSPNCNSLSLCKNLNEPTA
jgi:hypothetical protein